MKQARQAVYLQIADEIRSRITEKVYTNQLPPEQILGNEFSVNVKTLRKALGVLIGEGVLYSRNGLGNFISAPQVMAPSLVGAFLLTSGHVFAELSHMLSLQLQRRGLIPAILDSSEAICGKNGPLSLQRLLKMPLQALVFDGDRPHLFPLVQEYAKGLPCLICILSKKGVLPAHTDCILIDYEFAFARLTHHLLDLGRQRIAIQSSESEFRDGAPVSERLQGYLQALRRQGDEPFCRYWDNASIENEKEEALRRLVTEDKIDAVISINDAQARWTIERLQAWGISVPDDIAVVGMFNTPWATSGTLGLTTMSIREQDIAIMVADIALKGKSSGKQIMVQPELIVRQSCGS